MTWHTLKGSMYTLSNPGFTTPTPPGGDPNIAIVFDVLLGGIATTQSKFEDHITINGFRLALVANWGGALSDDTGTGLSGTSQIYFDPNVPGALRDNKEALGDIRSQLELFLRGEYGTTFQFFKGFDHRDSKEAVIDISVRPDDEQFTIRVGDLGLMQMTPIRGVGDQLVRLLHAEPEFRDNVIQASDKGIVSFWRDDIAKWQGKSTTEISDFYWKWSALKPGVQMF